MAFKNFVFSVGSKRLISIDWVGSKVAGMKTTFFALFDPTWTHIVAPKGPNK